MIKLAIQISKGILRDTRVRRSVMFYAVLCALVLLFVGATFLDQWLRERPLLFLGFWAVCAWVTLLSVLLALFDMLLVRAAARAEKRRLARRYLAGENLPDDRDEDAR